MAKLTLGEVRIDDDRFPGLVLTIGRKHYRVERTDASRFGQQMADGAREAVARVDIDVLREVITEIELTPL